MMGCERLDNVKRIGIVIKLRLLAALVALAMVPGFAAPISASETPDVSTWTIQVSAGDYSWSDVAFGNGVFVAVADVGDIRVMTSPDAVTWTLQTSAPALAWKRIAFGGGLFVAVAGGGVLNPIMTSPDGITWTRQTYAESLHWQSITYGAGLFVAVAGLGAGNRVMTSPDGVTWTGRAASLVQRGSLASAQQGSWAALAYGNGLFVAASWEDEVMTSPNGVTWTTTRDGINSETWVDIVFGNGLFVAVSQGGNAMKSLDGIVWQESASTSSNSTSISYGDGYFVGVTDYVDSDQFGGYTSVTDQVFTSTNGFNWSQVPSPIGALWNAVTYGAGRFVAVSSSGSGNRVMRSGIVAVTPPAPDPAPPAPDPAAVEAARLAEERAAIAEAARLRQIEIDNYRTALFAKLIRGERPVLSEYNNAIFYQITSRTIETVTDQILQLDPAQRSDIARVNSIADGAAFYDAFFNPAFPATVGTYNLYGYFGITERILEKVNAQVQMLPVIKRADGITIEEIIATESFIDQLSNPETRRSVTTDRLVKMGLLSASSIHKVSVLNALRTKSDSELDSIEKIKLAIATQLSEIQERKDRTAAIKVKIQTRKK